MFYVISNEMSNRSSLKNLSFLALRLGMFSWGGFIAQIPPIERLLCGPKRNLPLDLVRRWEHKAIILPGPSFVNFFAIAGYSTGGLVGAFFVPMLLFLPGSILVCALLAVIQVIPSIGHAVNGVDSIMVFALGGGMIAGGIRFLRSSPGSLWYAVSGLFFSIIMWAGGNPGLSLLAVLLVTLFLTSSARKLRKLHRSDPFAAQ